MFPPGRGSFLDGGLPAGKGLDPGSARLLILAVQESGLGSGIGLPPAQSVTVTFFSKPVLSSVRHEYMMK